MSNPDQPERPQTPMFSGYWFPVPMELDLPSLPPGNLKVFLAICRSMRDKHPGEMSDRTLAEKTGLNKYHANRISRELIEAGFVLAVKSRGRGKTTHYTLPMTWKKPPTGVQIGQVKKPPTGVQIPEKCTPTGGHKKPPVGVQKCTPTGVQHSESSESSEGQIQKRSSSPSSSSSIGGSGGNATETTMTCPSSSENQNTETERLRQILTVYRQDFGWKGTLKGKPTDGTIRLFQKLGKTPDEIGVALESKGGVLIDRPIKTWRYVYKVLKAYFETESPEAAAKDREEMDALAKRVTGDRAQGPQPQILEAEWGIGLGYRRPSAEDLAALECTEEVDV